MAAKKPKTTEQQLAWICGQMAFYDAVLARLIQNAPNRAELVKRLDQDYEELVAHASERAFDEAFLEGLHIALWKLNIRPATTNTQQAPAHSRLPPKKPSSAS